ncbi:MAG: S24 family peptidase [Chromatiales bacterium]|nr:S24 family peptidase [Chromatiales bacterium]
MPDEFLSACGGAEPYALQVTDTSMEPEFPRHCIIIIEPVGAVKSGAYAIVDFDGMPWFRQYVEREDGAYLVALNDLYPEIRLEGNWRVTGVIVQRNVRRKIKHYHPLV